MDGAIASVVAVEHWAVPLLVVALMVSVGLRYPIDALLESVRGTERRRFAAVLAVDLVGVPLVALAAAWVFALPEAQSVGLLLIATCAGGPTGVLFAMNAGARVDLATGWTLAQLGMAAVVTPVVLQLHGATGASSTVVFATIALHQLLPLGLAMGARRIWPSRALRWSARAAMLANGLLLLVVVVLMARRGAFVLERASGVLLPALVLIGIAMGLGAWVTGPDPGRQHAGALVSGVRNISVALLLSERHFGGATSAAVLGAGAVSVLVPGAVAWFWARREASTEVLRGPPRR